MASGTVGSVRGRVAARGRMRRISSIMCGMSTATRGPWVDGESLSCRDDSAERLTAAGTIVQSSLGMVSVRVWPFVLHPLRMI